MREGGFIYYLKYPERYFLPQTEDGFLQYETRLACIFVVLQVGWFLTLFASSINRV